MGILINELSEKVRNLITNKNYKFKKENQGYSFTSKYNTYEFKIVISYSGYPNMYKLFPASSYITFYDVETILQKGVNLIISNPYLTGYTIQNNLIGNQNINISTFDKIIRNPSDFEEVAVELQKTIELGTYPFFEKFDSLQKVADFLSSLSPYEIVKYIQGPILFPKTLLILKLVNHKTYCDRFSEFISILEGKSNDINYKQIMQLCLYIDQM